jgi:hypothetical protein
MLNRDYYLLKGAKYDAFRQAYRDYIVKVQRLAGISDPEARANRIIALETQIAKIHWTPEQSRDVEKSYNPMSCAPLFHSRVDRAPKPAWARSRRLSSTRRASKARPLFAVPLQTGTTPLPPQQRQAEHSRNRSMTPSSISIRRRCATRLATHRQRGGPGKRCAAKASARSTCSAIIRPRAIAKCASSSATSSLRSRKR